MSKMQRASGRKNSAARSAIKYQPRLETGGVFLCSEHVLGIASKNDIKKAITGGLTL